MAVRNWTDEQVKAVGCDAADVLVSAGAGSGKTAVLTERIIRRLSDKEHPADITRMLIVTFTNAATAELRERVGLALRERLAADPGNRRLRRQLLLLPSAKIDTISSFCLGIVRSNLSALGLPAGLRVCDETESALLADEVMDQVINGFYDGTIPGIESFGEFCDAFVSDRDDRLADLFFDLYRKLIGYVSGVGLLHENARSLSAAADGGVDFMSTPWGESIAAELRARLDYYIAVLEQAIFYFNSDPALVKAYSAQFSHDLDFARELRALLEKQAGYTELRKLLGGYEPARLGTIRKLEPSDELVFYKKARSDFASSDGFVKKICKAHFSIDEAMLRSVLTDCAAQCENIYMVLSAFDERFTSEKRRRAIADYGDLERCAYRLLYGADGKVSDTARDVAADYDEIYVDEYQDVNELQDLIFSALAKAPAPAARRRFMVGDVKQSIYGFRGAAPSLFAAYRSDPAIKTLFLRSNFRSDSKIIDFVNRVSAHIFAGSGSEVEYSDGDRLICGKKSDGESEKVRVVLLNSKNGDKEDAETGEPQADAEIEIGEKLGDVPMQPQKYGEPEFVADEIARLVGSGKYKPGDIAILLRNASGRAEAYESALRGRSITAAGGSPEFFAQPEVLLMLCLLNCVRNPARDIYLAGALRSPLYNFTFDELIRIRRFTPSTFVSDDGDVPFYLDGDEPSTEVAAAQTAVGHNTGNNYSLYEALKLYTEQTGFEKGRRFLDKLDDYRAYAEGNPADRVVRYIYRDAAIMAYAAGESGTQGEQASRKRNLTRLYELARTFENGQFRGLSDFLEFLDGLIKNGSAEASSSGDGEDRVRIMSIHKSKGLEFPVCFVCDCARAFNDSDSSRLILFDPKLGASAKLGDNSGFGRINTPVRTASALSITRRMKYEEMRSLYVAMTRARERLYITAALSDPEALLDRAALTASVLPSAAKGADVTAKNNYISWIADALSGKSDDSAEVEIYSSAPEIVSSDAEALSEPVIPDLPADVPDETEVERFKALFEPRLNFKYKWKPLEKLPAKLSVSKLYPSILDETGDDTALDISGTEGIIDLTALGADADISVLAEQTDKSGKPAERKFGPPRFLSSDPDEVTAAERGTATHIFMQFCDFARTEKYGVRDELARLVTGKFMTRAHADLVDVKAVERFFGGELYADMRRARKIYREVRFNVRLPASEFTQSEALRALLASERVLVQGVIDCYYESDDGSLKLIDYKTDYISRELRSQPGKAEALLIERHSRQLDYYAQAIERFSARKVSSSAIYSFSLGKTIYL